MGEDEEGNGRPASNQTPPATAAPAAQAPPAAGMQPAYAQQPPYAAYPQHPQYPPATAGYPPPSGYAPGHVTFKGTGRLKTAVLLTIVGTALSAAGSLGLWSVGDRATMGSVALFGILGQVGGLMVFIGAILGLMGLWDMNKGRAEFGRDHASALRRGRSYIIGGFLMEIIGFAAILIFTLIGASVNLQTSEVSIDPGAFVAGGVVAGVAGLVAVYLFAIGLSGFIDKLMTRAGRAKRRPFVAISVAGAVLSFGFQAMAFSAMDLSAATTGSLGAEAGGLTGLASLVGVVGLWIYRTMVEDAERGGRTMIETGRFDPDARAGP